MKPAILIGSVALFGALSMPLGAEPRSFNDLSFHQDGARHAQQHVAGKQSGHARAWFKHRARFDLEGHTPRRADTEIAAFEESGKRVYRPTRRDRIPAM